MSVAVTPMLADLYTAVRAFLLTLLPPATPVIQGLINRTAEPASNGFVVMTAIAAQDLSTTRSTWDTANAAPLSLTHDKSVQVNMQLDFYGAASFDWANTFTTLFRNDVGCAALAPNCQPLYATEARQAALIDGEEQYLTRWIVEAQLQYNPTVSTVQDFADTLVVGLINVDEAYPIT